MQVINGVVAIILLFTVRAVQAGGLLTSVLTSPATTSRLALTSP